MAIKPDVVHTHGYRPDVVAGSAARRSAIPTVSTVHGFTGGEWKNRFYEWIQGWSHRRFDAVVAVSRQQVGNIVARGVEPERVHVVQNAWVSQKALLAPEEARRILGLPSEMDARLLGWVGRLSREKGLDVLLEALSRLEGLHWKLAVVGEGAEEPPLRRLATSLGIDGRVHWAGYVEEAARLFRAFDLFCLSSRSEGTPIVLLEAMAAGVPVVATEVGGIADVVGPDSAQLVPPERPECLAAAIRRTLAEPDGARERARSARRRLDRRFDAGDWVRRYDEVYRSAMTTACRANE